MNIINMNHAIAIMKRAAATDAINMELFQTLKTRDSGVEQKYAQTEEQLHRCGNKACFAGYIAVSREFQTQQAPGFTGAVGRTGYPYIIETKSGFGIASREAAIARWLDISHNLAFFLVHNWRDRSVGLDQSTEHYIYQKKWSDVTGEDVVRVLEEILEKGTVDFFTEVLARVPEHDTGLKYLKEAIAEERVKSSYPV